MKVENWQFALNCIGMEVRFLDGQPGVVLEVLVNQRPKEGKEPHYVATVLTGGERVRCGLEALEPWTGGYDTRIHKTK